MNSAADADHWIEFRPRIAGPKLPVSVSQEVRSRVGRRDPIVELISAMTDALARNDEGDMDAPAWENARRIRALRAQLRLLSRRNIERASLSVTSSSGRIEGIAAS